MNDALFYSRNTKVPAKEFFNVPLTGAFKMPQEFAEKFAKRFPEKSATASGIPFDFKTMKTLASPDIELEREVNCEEAKQLFEQKKTVYMTAENAVSTWKLEKFKFNDKTRKYQDIVVYTSKYGKSTKTDRKGLEVAVDANGKIVELSGNCFHRTGDEKGDMPIPENGYVVSYGNSQPYLSHPGYGLFFKLQKGEKFKFVTDNENNPAKGLVMAGLKSKYRKLAIALVCTKPVRNGAMGFIEIKMDKGKSRFSRINGYIFTKGPSIFLEPKNMFRYNPWDVVKHGINPIIVLEFEIPANQQAKALYISANRLGAVSGLSVLGATQY